MKYLLLAATALFPCAALAQGIVPGTGGAVTGAVTSVNGATGDVSVAARGANADITSMTALHSLAITPATPGTAARTVNISGGTITNVTGPYKQNFLQSTLNSTVGGGAIGTPAVSATASFATSIMSVTVANRFIYVNGAVSGSGVPAGITVSSQINGTPGGAGDYQLSGTVGTVASAPGITITTPCSCFSNFGSVTFLGADAGWSEVNAASFGISDTADATDPSTGNDIVPIETGVEIDHNWSNSRLYPISEAVTVGVGGSVLGMLGNEVDARILTPTGVPFRWGFNADAQGGYQATGTDSAFTVEAGGAGAGWKGALTLVNNPGGTPSQPIVNTGYFLGTEGHLTLDTVLDFSNVTATSFVLNYPNVVIKGDGRTLLTALRVNGALNSGNFNIAKAEAGFDNHTSTDTTLCGSVPGSTSCKDMWISDGLNNVSTSVTQRYVPMFGGNDPVGNAHLLAAQFPALTGDVTTTAGSLTTTLATVNSSPGTYGSTSTTPVIGVNNKGLITAVSAANVTPAAIGAIPTAAIPSAATTAPECGSGSAGAVTTCTSSMVLPSGTTATTQAGSDSSTKVATTAMVQARAPIKTNFAAGTSTLNQGTGMLYVDFEGWGGGGSGGNGVALGAGVSGSGGGAGGGAGHVRTGKIAWSDLGVSSCTIVVGAGATTANAPGNITTITCGSFPAWNARAGGGGFTGTSGAASGGGGGGSTVSAGSSATNGTGASGGAAGGGSGGSGVLGGGSTSFQGSGGAGSGATGAVAVGGSANMGATGGGSGGGCNAGAPITGSAGGANETGAAAADASPASIPGTSGRGGGGGDASAGTASAGGTGAIPGGGGGGGGDGCNNTGTLGAFGAGGDGKVIAYQS